jgi:DNA invertase Pin-like site-specific DNA recombinase
MPDALLIPAAQYVRMSTDDQPNPIPFQRDAIQRYASAHRFEIVATYSDAGRSGPYIENRPGLRLLLRDVLSGDRRFQAILVYDVSRWGRFQDTDESAHYEFLCRRAGIPIYYCAEQFENDGRMQNTILKSLKRVMAAEYSRELGARISGVKRRLAAEGFHEGGAALYGLRRLLISENGHKRILQKGERKSLKSDHVVLTRGPKREVECVRAIFDLAAKKQNTPRVIAQELNRRKLRYLGNKTWDEVRVYRILKKEEYTGTSVWGRRIWLSSTRSKRSPRETWIIKPGAYSPIITSEQFAAAQTQLAHRRCYPGKSDKHYLDKLAHFLDRAKRMSPRSLARERRTISHMCRRRFGGLLREYELIGYKPSSRAINSLSAHNKIDGLREELFNQLKALFGPRVKMFHRSGHRRFRVLEVDNHCRVAVYVCRKLKLYASGARRWWVRIRPGDERMPTLFCIPNTDLNCLEAFYFVPDLGPTQTKWPAVAAEGLKWLSPENRLSSLADLGCVVTKAMGGCSQSPPEPNHNV